MQKKITLLLACSIMLCSLLSSAQFKISGQVLDERKSPLPFASVQVKGTAIAVQTDVNGMFELQLVDSNVTLKITAVGFSTKQIKVNRKHQILVQLVSQQQTLNEVVVIGYSNSRKKDLTGSVSSIRSANYLGQTKTYQNGERNYPPLERTQNTSIPPLSDTIIEPGDNNQALLPPIPFENRFLKSTHNPFSTFSIDVDGASYSYIRQMIENGHLPAPDDVRIEELLNYFHYAYPLPEGEKPFRLHSEMATCPWNPKHQLALIGLQGKKIEMKQLPPSNLVFLIDVSGSMMDENKLPLVKQSLLMLVDQLRPQDEVSMVVYAGNAGLVLSPTHGNEKKTIKAAIQRLEAGGSTNGAGGIELAYQTALRNFKKGGNNRVILCTDGDFNVGISDDDALESYIETKRSSGVFLSVLGFGTGNYQDQKMQVLADKGNGNHAYIDQLSEAKKVFINEFGGTLFTIAKDVKLQVSFNPTKVQGYRLIGYENRILNKEDFTDDKKDAGDLGSGQTVTALYELIPVGEKSSFLEKETTAPSTPISTQEIFKDTKAWMNVQCRYKQVEDSSSQLINVPMLSKPNRYEMSESMRFAAAVAGYGLLLKKSAFRQDADYKSIIDLAIRALGKDVEGYRKSFVEMVQKTAHLAEPDRYSDEDLSIEN